MRNVVAGRKSSFNLVSDASAWLRTFKKSTAELSSACMEVKQERLRKNLIAACDHSFAATSQ